MKTKTAIALVSLIMTFSCTVSEETDTQNLNEKAKQTTSPMIQILSKEGSKERLSSLFSSNSTAKENGSGVVFIENGADYVACGGGGGENWVCVYEIDDGFYQSPIDLTILPNGEAQFKAKSKNFAVEVYTPDFEELIYSNLCMDEFVGNLHINLKGTFELITDDPFVDFDYYTYLEGSTANNFQMTTLVDDGVRNLDIFNLTWDCEPPTLQKKLKVTSLFMPNGKVNIKIRGL